MRSLITATLVALTLTIPATASASDCGKVVDELSKAISGHLTMSPEQRVAAMRMAIHGYDRCMVGDKAGADATRDMIMTQVRKQLGSPN